MKEQGYYFDWNAFSGDKCNPRPAVKKAKVLSVKIADLKIPGKYVNNVPGFNKIVKHSKIYSCEEFGVAETVPTRVHFDDIEIYATLSKSRAHKLMKIYQLQKTINLNVMIQSSEITEVQAEGFIRSIGMSESGDINFTFTPNYWTINTSHRFKDF